MDWILVVGAISLALHVVYTVGHGRGWCEGHTSGHRRGYDEGHTIGYRKGWRDRGNRDDDRKRGKPLPKPKPAEVIQIKALSTSAGAKR